MKTFEHEVRTFNGSNRKGFEAMQKALREWGEAGYEIVSVTNDSLQHQNYVVFFKRERPEEVVSREEAA